uniref:Uncharacterized protein n=1 Tax=Candidozyma auris TaxID=498019 RepID=A0A0L0NYU5_CANAR
MMQDLAVSILQTSSLSAFSKELCGRKITLGAALVGVCQEENCGDKSAKRSVGAVLWIDKTLRLVFMKQVQSDDFVDFVTSQKAMTICEA